MQMTFTRSTLPVVCLVLLLLVLARPSHAGSIIVSPTAPLLNGADIAMLNTVGAFDTGGDDGHIWSDRPRMGQTFTTLSAPGAGYILDAVTLQNFNNNITNNTATWTVRVGTVSGTTFTPFHTETSNNSITYAPLDFLTFVFLVPVPLAPNTVFGFDWTSNGSGFVTTNNADSNYTGGTNFRHGDDQIPNDTALIFPGDDRIFHADIVIVPEPSSALLMASASLLALFRRRSSQTPVSSVPPLRAQSAPIAA
jgi:hypothetical protein